LSHEASSPSAPDAYPAYPPPAGPPVPVFDYQYARAPRPKFRDKRWKHVVLLLLTIVTTTFAGAGYYLSFISDFGRRPVAVHPSLIFDGLWYSIAVLAILGAHEMGHYLCCRRYNVDASLPYFIPAPLPLTGTLGAVIRIREAFPTRTILFDIGVAGPIAGFVVLLPVLFWGMALSQIVPTPRIESGLAFGEPLLFKAASWLVLGPIGQGQSLNAHPMVFAAWFGMFATALNLLPFGQLDGGHLTYATLQRHSTVISIATVLGAIDMCFFSTGWYAMTLIMIVMLIAFGPRHPRVLDEQEPLGPGRIAVTIFALVMLVLCFTPIPIEPLELLGRR
jgi:membrane-associated protease RseP (regulator of RpoE activity)